MPTFIRLTDYKSSDKKEQEFFNPENRYEAKQEDFEKIPATPIAYWVSKKTLSVFSNSSKLYDLYESGGRCKTHNDERFLRLIWEVNSIPSKWKLYNKGGEYRKWYGNIEHFINWSDEAKDIYSEHGGLSNSKYWDKRGITWSGVTSGQSSYRFKIQNSEYASAAPTIILEDNLLITLAFLNTKISNVFMKIINPTLQINVGDALKLPFILPSAINARNKIEILTQQNIDISKEGWDSRETSWDFKKNELIKHKTDSKIDTSYSNYCNYWREQHNTLHQNEEELNRLFIDIYELQDELTPEVELKDITVLKQESHIDDNGELVFNADEIMKQFISYAVGVMFGRYSLDTDGLIVANMGQEIPTSTTFEIDDDNVIPVLDDDYFKDDIASRFVQFVKTTFGEENLSENIRFIESSLGTTIRKYFVKGFYDDHIKRYKKRPIYWMVASPKKGFMSLIYMHRYQSDIFARVRNSYLSEYIAKLEAHKDTLHLTTTSDTASDKDKKDADRRIKDIDTKLKELIAFDRDTMMSYAQNNVDIDLDDGVKVNYSKFQEILYEIKGLNKDE